MSKTIAFLCFIRLSLYAQEMQQAIHFQDPAPLSMTLPNLEKEKPTKWIPLSQNFQETLQKKTTLPAKTINESIKIQVQKKIQALLKPLDDEKEE